MIDGEGPLSLFSILLLVGAQFGNMALLEI